MATETSEVMLKALDLAQKRISSYKSIAEKVEASKREEKARLDNEAASQQKRQAKEAA